MLNSKLNTSYAIGQIKSLSVVAFFLINASILSGQSLYINEFMAGNNTIPDEYGEFDDWIEIYNGGSIAVNLEGYFLSDNIANPMVAEIDTAVIVQPGGFVLFWADKDLAQGKLHLDFKLSAGGEQISLMSPTGDFIDSLTYGPQLDDLSYGRYPDGSSSFFIFEDPTPDEPNSASGSVDQATPPVFNMQGGFYDNTFSLALSHPISGAEIYYTLDGEDPDESSTLYTGAINISTSSIVRAKAYVPDYLSSNITSHSYFLNESYTLPVLSIVTDPDNMFGPTGIYSNPLEGGSEWERYCQIQYFKNENLDFSIDCGIRIQGSSSVTLPKKSFRLFFDEDYGQSRLEYPMFEGTDVMDFKNLVLRAGYDDDITDEDGTLLRDPYGNRQYKESGGLITEGNWAILKINGAYWGVYEVRESLNKEFIESHTGYNDFDLVRFDKSEPELKNGTWEDWDYMRNFLENNDMSDEANYAHASELIDMENLINVQALIQCSSYRSWSYGISTYKKKSPGSKWKYTVWDMDRSHSSQWWNPHDDYAEDESLTWGNFLNEALTANETFRNKLVNRVADLLNTAYRPDNASEYLENMRLEIDAEMEGEYDRWNPTEDINTWYDNLGEFDTLLLERPAILRDFTIEYYSFPDSNRINLDIQGEGSLKLSTIDIPGFPWSGAYYEDVPVPITAIPAPGYSFIGWSDPSLPNNPDIELMWDGTYDLVAYFELGSTEVADVIINEINYNSPATIDAGDWIELYNASGMSVDVSGWSFRDGSGDYFNIPSGVTLSPDSYLVLVEDSVRFQQIYPTVTNFIGAFGNALTGSFKLSNSGEFISISNADASYIDTVFYKDELPWPVEPDGTGPSLQLINPSYDNALAESWFSEIPTPNAQNTGLQGQTIDFDPISDKLVTDNPFVINATSSSGLPVSFSIVSGPASISGNTITLDGVGGTVIVQADQAGDTNYAPAVSTQQSFDVELLSQSISFGALSDKLTTDIPFNILAISTSGLTVSFSILSGPASISGNTITLDGIGGTVVVEANQSGNATYQSASSVQQIFEVNLQSQSISFNSISDKITTDMPFAITATASSGLGVNFSIVSGPASVSGNTITLDGVGGTVVVEASQSGSDDYLPASSVEQSFEVNLQSQSISFNSISDKITTDIPFAISATASSGLGVNFSIVSGPASVSGNTITLDGVGGTVVVEASQSGSDDYLPASSVEQSFEVNLQSQTISFGNISDKITTDAPFVISATASSGLVVSYNIISGPASVSGNIITLDGVGGTVVVEANQSGSDDYLPASSVEQSFEVSLQNQTINFNDISDKVTTDAPFTISATSTSGLAVGFIIVSGPASISGDMITLDGVSGTVIVEANQLGNATYLPALSQQQSFEVSLQSQSINFPSIPNKLDTDDPFTITATSTSGLAVDFNIVSGPASISGNTITLDGLPGMVTVEASQQGNSDYLPATNVQQTFVITEEILLSQTIEFLPITDKFTTDVPFAIAATSTSGLTVDFNIVSGPASISGNIISLNGVAGTVVIQADQDGDADYYPAIPVQQSFEVILQSQTIAFENISDKIATDMPFNIMATASSGLAIDFNIVSGPASISGDVITLDGVGGTVIVEASQSGNNDYLSADAQQSFEVLLADQTIDFVEISNKFTTDVPFEIMASASSGLDVSYIIVSGPASIAGNIITLDGVGGTVVVQANQAGNSTYNPAPILQETFDVLLQSQTIDFEDIPDKITTDIPFEIMATASTGLDLDYTIISGPASIAGNTISLDGVGGTVVVEASQSGSDDYFPANIQQSFEVLLTDQTINFDAIPNKITTDVPFTVMATTSSGLDVTYIIVSGPASISGNVITLDGLGGTVVVQADQLGNATYNPAAFVQETFEVNLQSQTIDFVAIPDKFTTDMPFGILATASSGLDVSFSIVSGPASLVGDTITLDGVEGLVVVQASQIGDNDFLPAPSIEQSFEVNLVDHVENIGNNDLEFVVYPNPADDLLYILLNDVTSDRYEVSIYDVHGRLVQQETMVNFGANEYKLDIDTLSDGVFILTLVKDGKIYSSRFLKISY